MRKFRPKFILTIEASVVETSKTDFFLFLDMWTLFLKFSHYFRPVL